MFNDADDERELDEWNEELNDGRITMAEYNERMQQRQRDYREAAEEAAEEAYRSELRNW